MTTAPVDKYPQPPRRRFLNEITGRPGDDAARDDIAFIFSPLVLSLLAIAFLYPILVCALFFPTPYVDLREHINWGLNAPLSTLTAAPLPSWISALASLVGFRDAWFYMVVAQGLNVVTFCYLIRIAREFVGVDAVAPFVLVGACSFYLSAWLPTTALNADQVQAPLWAGAIYYALRARKDDRWKDWLLLGAVLGLAMLTKYFTLIFIAALAAAAAALREFRPVFVNRKLYVAALLGIAIVMPHAAAELRSRFTLNHGLAYLHFQSSLIERLHSLWNLFAPVGLLLLPLAIVAAKSWWSRAALLQWRTATPRSRFILAVALAFAVIMAAMILGAALEYRVRFSYAWLPIAVLVTFCLVRVAPNGLHPLAEVTLAIWVAVCVGSVAYGLTVLREQLREPAPAAAAAMRRDWDSKFACGPGYIIGDRLEAQAVALYYGDFRHRIVGLSNRDYAFAPWPDMERIRRLGAIVVRRPKTAPRLNNDYKVDKAEYDFPERTEAVTLSLPYRRTWSDKLKTYVYSFIRPHDC